MYAELLLFYSCDSVAVGELEREKFYFTFVVSDYSFIIIILYLFSMFYCTMIQTLSLFIAN